VIVVGRYAAGRSTQQIIGNALEYEAAEYDPKAASAHAAAKKAADSGAEEGPVQLIGYFALPLAFWFSLYSFVMHYYGGWKRDFRYLDMPRRASMRRPRWPCSRRCRCTIRC